MSGEDDRGQAKPGAQPYFDESDIPPPARPRRKAKPPPNIITAGGVDMARGHASGIQIREGAPAEPTTHEPRVVIAVETDLRKVPTHRRLLTGRDPAEDGARAALLPDSALPAPRPRALRDVSAHPTPVSTEAARPPKGAETLRPPAEPAPPPAPEGKQLPIWMRLSFAAVLLLVLVGVMRTRAHSPDAPQIAPLPLIAADIPPPPPPPPAPSPAPTAVVEAPPPAPPVPSAAPSPPSPPPASHGVAHRPVRTPPPAPPAPRATFTPPFQLPSEKN